MLEIGRKGIFTVSPPYLLPPVEYEIIAIHSLSAMLTLGLDPFKLVYEPVGLDKTFYQALPKSTQICLMKSSVDLRHVPKDALLHEDTSSYINYVDKSIIINMGAHPSGTTFPRLVTQLAAIVAGSVGVSPIIDVRNTSKALQISGEEHLQIVDDREKLITSTRPIDLTSLREREILLLTSRIKALEQFLILYTQTCGSEDCICTATQDNYAANIVFYQYPLADYVLQAARGDIHDFPINNVFVNSLHDDNVSDYLLG